MKSSIILTCVLLLLCGCSHNKTVDYNEHKQLLDEYEYLELEYEEEVFNNDELLNETEEDYEELLNDMENKYDELLIEYNESIDYYKELCKKCGYLTYEEVYWPDLCSYYSNDTCHMDWLCKNFNKNLPYQVEYREFDEPETLCELCCADDASCSYLLDVKAGVFHLSYTDCLDIGTKNFKTPNIIYRRVYFNSAINANYTPCPKCISDENKQ